MHRLEADPGLKAQLTQHLQRQNYDGESSLASVGLVEKPNSWLKKQILKLIM